MSGRAVILTPLPGDGNPKPVFEKTERPWIPAYAGMTEAAPEKGKEAGP